MSAKLVLKSATHHNPTQRSSQYAHTFRDTRHTNSKHTKNIAHKTTNRAVLPITKPQSPTHPFFRTHLTENQPDR